MLDSILHSLNTHSFVDKDLEQCLKYCATKLTTHTPLRAEIINETLERLESGLAQYAKKCKENCFRLLKGAKTIKFKKATLAKLTHHSLTDIIGAVKILACYNQLLMHNKMADVDNYRCAERFNSLLDFSNDVLNEIIRINAYGDNVKDNLKFQIAILHDAIGQFHFFLNNHASAILAFSNMLTVADTITEEYLKESFLAVSNILMFVDCHLNHNNLATAANILRMEKEKCCAEAVKLYYGRCVELAGKYALQADYPNAIAWFNTALNLHESFELNIKLNNILEENVNAMAEYLLTIDKDVFIDQELPDLRNNKRMMLASDYQVTIPVAIPEWSPELMARMKQLAGKYSLEFVAEKLTIHKLSSVGVAGLTKIVKAIHQLEREYQKKQHKQLILQAVEPLDELKSSLAALTIATPLPEISPVSSSSAMAPSCSTDPIKAPNKGTAVKTKTRGKAHKRGQYVPKAIAPVTPACDAEKYGFSRSLFGMRAFHECRMRGDSSRVFYVVEGHIEASNKRGDNHQKFAGLIAEPKIVPPCGEEGFKWMKVDGRQVLVGKVLDTKKRLFPTVAQRNDQGAIAFLYGQVVNTKNGIPSQTVKHYMSAAKRKPS